MRKLVIENTRQHTAIEKYVSDNKEAMKIMKRIKPFGYKLINEGDYYLIFKNDRPLFLARCEK
jgi:hypothetical protein